MEHFLTAVFLHFLTGENLQFQIGVDSMGMLTVDVGMEMMLFDGKAQAKALMAKKMEEMQAQDGAQALCKAERGNDRATPIAKEILSRAHAQ